MCREQQRPRRRYTAPQSRRVGGSEEVVRRAGGRRGPVRPTRTVVVDKHLFRLRVHDEDLVVAVANVVRFLVLRTASFTPTALPLSLTMIVLLVVPRRPRVGVCVCIESTSITLIRRAATWKHVISV